MPIKPAIAPIKYCHLCNAILNRKRINGRMEDMEIFKKRKYCNRSCMALAMMKQDPTRDAYRKRAYIHKKKYCELCAKVKHLAIHHIDRNWRNNDPSNLQTLCSSCHTSLHHSQGHIVEVKPKLPCSVCGKPSYRASLCNTHRTQLRRHGRTFPLKSKTG